MYCKNNLLRFALFIFLLGSPFFAQAITVEVTATVAGCGDAIISNGEQCDGVNLGGSSCSLLGFNSGSLSCTSACTFNTSQCTSSGGGGGGGGGGSSNSGDTPYIPNTNVIFSGRAYPLSRISILKDGQLVVTTIAGPDSNFTATFSGISKGNYNFTVYSEDKNNVRSAPFTFPVFISSGVTTKISGIFIAPTITIDKSHVRQGDPLIVSGQSAPNTEITISVNSEPNFLVKKYTDSDGIYILNFDTSVLDKGQHTTQSKSKIADEASQLSKILGFLVGSETKFITLPTQTPAKGDLNGDGRVNLVDFSIAAYWYKRVLGDNFISIEADRLNGDKAVDLIDFSIMAFYWTG